MVMRAKEDWNYSSRGDLSEKVSQPMKESLLRRWNGTPEWIDELKTGHDAWSQRHQILQVHLFPLVNRVRNYAFRIFNCHDSNHADLFLKDNSVIQLLERSHEFPEEFFPYLSPFIDCRNFMVCSRNWMDVQDMENIFQRLNTRYIHA